MRLTPKQLKGVGLAGALSSVVEHYLHTVGVAGSKPAARTIPPERGVFSVPDLAEVAAGFLSTSATGRNRRAFRRFLPPDEVHAEKQGYKPQGIPHHVEAS
jgi:hypothetical protein